jgi:hypothetical protein
MKFKLGGNQYIEFATDVAGLEDIARVKPSKFFIPQWFKDMKETINTPASPDGSVPGRFERSGDTAKKWTSGTVKRCPAIVDLISEGFIIPMWSDFLLQNDGTILEWDNKNFPYGIEFHNTAQIYNWPLKKNDFPEGVKFTNPWRIYTPPGYSVMFTQPTYQFEKRFTVLPGIVETDSYHHINFPTIIHTKKDIIIERGTPFIQVIPFKRDDWKFQVGQMTEKQKYQDITHKTHLSSKFKNAYRSITSSFKNS